MKPGIGRGIFCDLFITLIAYFAVHFLSLIRYAITNAGDRFNPEKQCTKTTPPLSIACLIKE